MSQVAQWLETLGMAEYAERFVENRIGLSVLRELTDQDLKDLGIVLGDRRKLLRAIRELDALAPAAAADAAERRQLTLMFCDLVGSTMLQALLALGLGDARNGVVARATRQMAPSTEPQKSRKRNGPPLTVVLDMVFTSVITSVCCVASPRYRSMHR